MAAKKKAAGAATGVVAAGQAVRSNPYLQRVAEDDELRENLRLAFESSRKAYARMSNGKGPTKALLDDKKTQKELKKAAGSLSDVADSLRGAKKGRKRRRGGLLLLILVGAGAGLALSEPLRKRVLDLLFGAEEEFEYTSTTTSPPPPPTPPAAGGGSSSPSGSTSSPSGSTSSPSGSTSSPSGSTTRVSPGTGPGSGSSSSGSSSAGSSTP